MGTSLVIRIKIIFRPPLAKRGNRTYLVSVNKLHSKRGRLEVLDHTQRSNLLVREVFLESMENILDRSCRIIIT